MSFLDVARRAMRPAGTLTAAVALSSCSLDVANPDRIAVGDVQTPSGATALRNGAIQDFAIMFSGTQDGFIMMSGNLGDEVLATDTFFDRLRPNERTMNENLGGAVDVFYRNMHLARSGTTKAIQLWTTAKPTTAVSKDTLSELYSIRGYVEGFFGEAYCSGVPFSEEVSNAPVYGTPQTTAQIFTRAVATFDTAITNATATNFRHLAAVGRGRALLNLGQFVQAAAAVTSVPTNFRYQTFHSAATTRQENGVWRGASVAGSRYTVANNEGTNGYNFLQSPADPRMPWAASTRRGFDGTTLNMPTQLKYLQPTAATLADGIEARLIELEAGLQGGTQANRDALLAGLNTLRATAITPAMTAIATAPATQTAAVDLLFRERAAWLWLTGHRLGDMRRLVRQYSRPSNTVYPVGPVLTRAGTVYGEDVNFIIPFDETNNPNFKACLNRAA